MRHDSLSLAEQAIVETFRSKVRENEVLVRNQALTDVCSILQWLTATPGYTVEQLTRYTIREFEKTAKDLPESAGICHQIAFYKKCYEERFGVSWEEANGPVIP